MLYLLSPVSWYMQLEKLLEVTNTITNTNTNTILVLFSHFGWVLQKDLYMYIPPAQNNLYYLVMTTNTSYLWSTTDYDFPFWATFRHFDHVSSGRLK